MALGAEQDDERGADETAHVEEAAAIDASPAADAAPQTDEDVGPAVQVEDNAAAVVLADAPTVELLAAALIGARLNAEALERRVGIPLFHAVAMCLSTSEFTNRCRELLEFGAARPDAWSVNIIGEAGPEERATLNLGEMVAGPPTPATWLRHFMAALPTQGPIADGLNTALRRGRVDPIALDAVAVASAFTAIDALAAVNIWRAYALAATTPVASPIIDGYRLALEAAISSDPVALSLRLDEADEFQRLLLVELNKAGTTGPTAVLEALRASGYHGVFHGLERSLENGPVLDEPDAIGRAVQCWELTRAAISAGGFREPGSNPSLVALLREHLQHGDAELSEEARDLADRMPAELAGGVHLAAMAIPRHGATLAATEILSRRLVHAPVEAVPDGVAAWWFTAFTVAESRPPVLRAIVATAAALQAGGRRIRINGQYGHIVDPSEVVETDAAVDDFLSPDESTPLIVVGDPARAPAAAIDRMAAALKQARDGCVFSAYSIDLGLETGSLIVRAVEQADVITAAPPWLIGLRSAGRSMDELAQMCGVAVLGSADRPLIGLDLLSEPPLPVAYEDLSPNDFTVAMLERQTLLGRLPGFLTPYELRLIASGIRHRRTAAGAAAQALTDLASARVKPAPLRRAYEYFARSGQLPRMREAVETALPLMNLPRLETESLKMLIRVCRRLGLTANLAARLMADPLPMFEKHGDATIDLGELLAAFCPQPVTQGILIAVLARACQAKAVRPVVRLLDLMRRYADAETMRMAALLVASSPHAEQLRSSALRSVVAEGLLSQASFALPDLPASGILKGLQDEAPLWRRLQVHIGAADPERVRDDLMELIDTDTALETVFRVVRHETATLAGTDLRDLPYHAHADRVHLAALLDDKAGLEWLRPEWTERETAEVGAGLSTYLGDYEPLAAFLAELAPDGPAPLKLSGGHASLVDLMRSVCGAPVTRPRGNAKPRVSIVMTAFNPHPDEIGFAVASIRQQTLPEWELLLVDDASEPEARAQLEELARIDKRIRYFRSDVNIGAYAGRNLAMEHALGEFIAIADADDFMHPDRLAHQVAQMDARPELQLTCSQNIRLDTLGRVQFETMGSIFGDGTMTSTFRRTAFDAIGPFLSVRSRGDVEMRQRIRRFFGEQSYHQDLFPLVFCAGHAGTLSNLTASTKRHYLQLFRSMFAEQHSAMLGFGDRREAQYADVPLNLRS